MYDHESLLKFEKNGLFSSYVHFNLSSFERIPTPDTAENLLHLYYLTQQAPIECLQQKKPLLYIVRQTKPAINPSQLYLFSDGVSMLSSTVGKFLKYGYLKGIEPLYELTLLNAKKNQGALKLDISKEDELKDLYKSSEIKKMKIAFATDDFFVSTSDNSLYYTINDKTIFFTKMGLDFISKTIIRITIEEQLSYFQSAVKDYNVGDYTIKIIRTFRFLNDSWTKFTAHAFGEENSLVVYDVVFANQLIKASSLKITEELNMVYYLVHELKNFQDLLKHLKENIDTGIDEEFYLIYFNRFKNINNLSYWLMGKINERARAFVPLKYDYITEGEFVSHFKEMNCYEKDPYECYKTDYYLDSENLTIDYEGRERYF